MPLLESDTVSAATDGGIHFAKRACRDKKVFVAFQRETAGRCARRSAVRHNARTLAAAALADSLAVRQRTLVPGPLHTMGRKERLRVKTVLTVTTINNVVRKLAVMSTIVHLPSIALEEEVVVDVVPRAAVICIETLARTVVCNDQVVIH